MSNSVDSVYSNYLSESIYAIRSRSESIYNEIEDTPKSVYTAIREAIAHSGWSAENKSGIVSSLDDCIINNSNLGVSQVAESNYQNSRAQIVNDALGRIDQEPINANTKNNTEILDHLKEVYKAVTSGETSEAGSSDPMEEAPIRVFDILARWAGLISSIRNTPPAVAIPSVLANEPVYVNSAPMAENFYS
jgi:hypothetical protein